MLNWVLEITGTLHPLCKPQHFSLLGARGATRQIIRAGGSARPQHWGKRGISGKRKIYEGGGWGGTDWVNAEEVVVVTECNGVCVCVLKLGFTCEFRQNTSRRVMLYSCSVRG